MKSGKKSTAQFPSLLIDAIIFVTKVTDSFFVNLLTYSMYWDAIHRIIRIIMKKNRGKKSPKNIDKDCCGVVGYYV